MGIYDDRSIKVAMDDHVGKAWDSLSRYKFMMFGYHAACWVNLNKLLDEPHNSPFRQAVELGRDATSRRN